MSEFISVNCGCLDTHCVENESKARPGSTAKSDLWERKEEKVVMIKNISAVDDKEYLLGYDKEYLSS